MNRRLFVVAAVALAGCATGPPAMLLTSPAVMEELEPIHVVRTDGRALTIRVRADGCVRKEHFSFYVDREMAPASLAFARRPTAGCRPGPGNYLDLTFTWSELGLRPREPVQLLNPLLAWPVRPR